MQENSCENKCPHHSQLLGKCFRNNVSSPRVRFFGKIRIRIFDPRSVGSWCIKGTDESTQGKDKDSSVPLMHHDPSDLGSKIRMRIFPKKLHVAIDKGVSF